jgi:hypothetical protein
MIFIACTDQCVLSFGRKGRALQEIKENIDDAFIIFTEKFVVIKPNMH